MAMEDLFEIIAEDDELLALNKPAGLVCHPTKGDPTSSLIGRLRLYLGPNAALHLINRLDRETSGVVLVAKNDATARELRRLWEEGMVRKQYLAIAHGHVPQTVGVVNAPLGPDEQSRVAVKSCVRPGGRPARTGFNVIARFLRDNQAFSLLEVHPVTGRKHQIRIHLAHFGHPIVGDKLYGHDEDLSLALVENRWTEADRRRLLLPCHALHAASLRFPWRERWSTLRAEPEPWFKEFLQGVVWPENLRTQPAR
jgi:23S rRNA pseudouridine1911/1915/1917 synthase